MTVTLELAPDTEARLIAQARANGRTVEQQILAMVDEAEPQRSDDEVRRILADIARRAYDDGLYARAVIPDGGRDD